MKGRLAPRILVAPLFIALVAAPSIMQEGLVSLWAPWGVPLAAAAGVFAMLAGAIRVARTLGGLPRRARKAQDGGEPASADGPGFADAGHDNQEEEGTKKEKEAAEEEQDAAQPDLMRSEALKEMGPENLMDLALALQEMGRHGDALEALARVTELQEGDYGKEVAQALRRTRRRLRQQSSLNT